MRRDLRSIPLRIVATGLAVAAAALATPRPELAAASPDAAGAPASLTDPIGLADPVAAADPIGLADPVAAADPTALTSDPAYATHGILGAVPPGELARLNNGRRMWRVSGRTPGSAYQPVHLQSTNSNQNGLAHLFIGGLNRTTGQPEGLHFAPDPNVEKGQERVWVARIDAGDPDPAPSLVNKLTAVRPLAPGTGSYTGPDDSGVFRGEVWARSSISSGAWIKKAGTTTFFPTTWNTGTVLDAVDAAHATARRIREGNPSLWEGTVTDPMNPNRVVTIAMARNPAGEVVTAYPLYAP